MAYDLPALKQTYLTQFFNTLLAVLEDSGAGGDIITPRLTLIALTKVKIDELMPQSEGTQFSLTAGDNSNVIDLYINSLLDESTKDVLQTAPISIIVPADGGEIALVKNSDFSGYILLPDDYLRFVAFKLNQWLQDANEPITIDDPRYKLQRYLATRGGISNPVVVKNSKTVVQVAVKKVVEVSLLGSSGKCIIDVNGLEKEAEFDSDLETTADNFVDAHAAAYLATAGLILTNVVSVLVFTANVAGVDFVNPNIRNTVTDLNGLVSVTQVNVPARAGKLILEYYSASSASVTLEKFLYVAEIGAAYLQANLHPALTWMCASKLLQIWGQVSGQTSYSEKAMAQVELSYKNLL